MRYVWFMALPIAVSLVTGCQADLNGNRSPDANSPENPGGPGQVEEILPLTLDPGRTTLRRLTRAEYTNTLRDLLGTTQSPGDSLPGDEIVEGLDSVGSALSFALVHLETMEGKTWELMDELFALPASDPKRAKVLSCSPTAVDDECTEKILSAFARRAYRRPVAEEEVNALVGLVKAAQTAGNGFEDSLKAGLQAVLLSPHFIFRVELTGGPDSTESQRLNSHELATRLSYFLWSTMPDEELTQLADENRLTDEGELLAQVDRLLSDPKIEGLTKNFAGQWLPVRRLPQVTFDATQFPDYDESLRISAARETELFFEALVAEDRPLTSILTADFTFVNARLAKHYGIEGVPGDDFVRVNTAGTSRMGLLTQASVLMATSQPIRTSPVKRGIWVLEQMLCSPPPPVPNDIEIGDLELPVDATVRQTLEAHRADPGCASCHKIIDPLGFGLENFDAIGAYRTTENGQPVDASGILDGVPFDQPEELISLLVEDERLTECIAQQLLTYAVGRNFHESVAKKYARAFAQHTARADQNTWRQFLTAVVMSEAFQTRRPEAP